MWSLAVEEQFYLVWPVVAARAVAVVPLGRGAPLVVAASGGVASVIAMSVLFDPGRDPSRAYYGTDAARTRILIGVVLARAPARPGVRSASVAISDALEGRGRGRSALPGVGVRHGRRTTRLPLPRRLALVAIATAAVIASVVTAARPTPGPLPVAAAVGLRGPDLLRPLSLALADRVGPDPRATGLSGIPLLGVRVLATFAIAYLSWSWWRCPSAAARCGPASGSARPRGRVAHDRRAARDHGADTRAAPALRRGRCVTPAAGLRQTTRPAGAHLAARRFRRVHLPAGSSSPKTTSAST